MTLRMVSCGWTLESDLRGKGRGGGESKRGVDMSAERTRSECILDLDRHAHLSLLVADIISTVDFDQTGDYLATGDKGGRVVLFERNESVTYTHQAAGFWTSTELPPCTCRKRTASIASTLNSNPTKQSLTT